MERDFTLSMYGKLLDAILRRFGTAVGIRLWHVTQAHQGCVIRHDVDRRPGNAVRMAELERSMGVSTTYYFRVIGEAFDIDAMQRVSALGHEVGYHYEDLALVGGDMHQVIESFSRHLAVLRQYVDVRTVAMHGSPLSRYNNLDMWECSSLRQFELDADAFLSVDYRGVSYFTDTGRNWSGGATNLRDCPPTAAPPPASVSTTQKLVNYIAGMKENVLAISVHPERWDDRLLPWSLQCAKDAGANGIKMALRLLRPV